jgi:hypothetical protein
MLCRRHTSKERTDRVRGPASILFMSLIAFAGAQCKRHPAEPAKPVTKRVTKPVARFSIEYQEKGNPLDYFPLAVGNKWTYASIDKTGVNGSRKSIVTVKWITEHVITAAYDIPEGKVFLGEFLIRDVQYDEPADANEAELRWFRDHPPRGPVGLWAKDYLVAGNYVFSLPEQWWDAAAKGLSARYREELPSATPELFFPFDGACWWSDRVTEERDCQAALLFEAGKGPAPNPSTYYWNVNEREDVKVPYGKVRDAMKLTYTANCGTATVWFKEGLGFAKAGFIHGGSYNECETTLVAFAPAQAAK